MALADRPLVARLVEEAEDRLGVALRSPSRVRELEVREQEFMSFANDVESLGLYGMDYFHGRPSEMRPERRKRIAQRSRRALMEDPLAGAEAGILGDFGFGKGVPRPVARDPKVQEVVDRAWSDANNQEKLTSYQAQRKLSNELLTCGELFLTLYERGGKIRVGRLDPDLVFDVMPDPEDRLRPLFYLTTVRKYEWDFDLHQPKTDDMLMRGDRPKVMYWPHWRNVDDAQEERAEGVIEDGEQQLELPPPDMTAKGVVYHVAINQTGEQLRGNPPWARSLRFFTAMNVLTESHVTMAQAASTFVARRVMRGTPRQLSKAVNAVISQASELGAGRAGWGGGTSDYRVEGTGGSREYPTGSREEPPTRPFGAGPPQMPPGSWWNENESSRLEALNLQSGAGQMAQSAQIVRAPIAASSQFGQHYLGDPSDSNLATASTLELPATMRITGWQQWFEDTYRWFTDRAIEAAVKAGLLGDKLPDDESATTPLASLRLHEAEDISAMEARTGRDLSYEFTMPFPGRRQLPDVGTFLQTVCTTMDPNGVSKALRRTMLRFAYEQMGIDDVATAVMEAIPEKDVPGGIGSSDFQPQGAPPGGGQPGANGASANGGPPEDQQPYGARSNATPPGKAEPAAEAYVVPDEVGDAVAGYTTGVGDLFSKIVNGAALAATRQLAANGTKDD